MLKLDDRDLAILRVLSCEGRITKAELASRINLTATPCWQRLKRLEKAGIIESYRALIDLRKITPHVVVFVAVELEHHRSENFQVFERAVEKVDEITACWALGGGYDYLMQMTCSDIEHYQTTIDQLLESRIGLAKYYTYVVTKPVKSPGAPPFAALLAAQDD